MTTAFDRAFDVTLKHEGGYANDPADRGGETYRGIARRFHPEWQGWGIIDAARAQPGFPGSLAASSDLDRLVRDVYRRLYWDRFQGDAVATLSEPIAAELFDTGVNMGVGRATGFLQRALNALNNRGSRWPDITEDGDFGQKTLAAMRACCSRGDDGLLLSALNVLQGAHYLAIARNDESQERFMRGWLKRVQLTTAA